jgi:hypothetical protein
VAAEKPLPEFKPLDADLKEKIREQLLRERALVARRAKIEAARNQMLRISEAFTAAVTKLPPELTAAERDAESHRIAKELQTQFSAELLKYAEQNKLRYVETRPLSSMEFYESENTRLPRPSSRPTNSRARAVHAVRTLQRGRPVLHPPHRRRSREQIGKLLEIRGHWARTNSTSWCDQVLAA